jgi:hypothetical protein
MRCGSRSNTCSRPNSLRSRLARALAAVATLQSADIVLPIIDGRGIRLRRVTSPTAEQRTLFQQRGVPLPESLSFDQECSADFAIARTDSNPLNRFTDAFVTSLG